MNPTYVQGDTKDIETTLEKFYSKKQIERLKKQNGIKIAVHLDNVWVKIGQTLIIIQDTPVTNATNAQVWWEYHFQLMPKVLEWKPLEP